MNKILAVWDLFFAIVTTTNFYLHVPSRQFLKIGNQFLKKVTKQESNIQKIVEKKNKTNYMNDENREIVHKLPLIL